MGHCPGVQGPTLKSGRTCLLRVCSQTLVFIETSYDPLGSAKFTGSFERALVTETCPRNWPEFPLYEGRQKGPLPGGTY